MLETPQMDWLFQLSVACIVAAALMLPAFRLFVVAPRLAPSPYRPFKTTPR